VQQSEQIADPQSAHFATAGLPHGIPTSSLANQHVFAIWIVAIKTLDRILHRGSKFPIRPTELLQEHVAESRIGCSHVDGVHQLLDMVIYMVKSSFLVAVLG
jgi:hypothetical protein